jgi:hypothetical protein
MKQKYTIPYCIMASPKLTSTEKLLWVLLNEYLLSRKSFTMVATRTLSRDLGCTKKQILKSLPALKNKNLIDLSTDTNDEIIEYSIIDHKYFSLSLLEEFIK